MTFPANILTEMKFYIGCSFSRSRTHTTLSVASQEAYIQKLLEKIKVTTMTEVPACPSVDPVDLGNRVKESHATSLIAKQK